MKNIVSISIGSSSRNHEVTTNICGEDFKISRIGTDGSLKKAIELVKSLDGKIDVFGMGGISLYLYGKNKKYTLNSALPIANAAQKTPMVDGSGIKDTVERNVVDYVNNTCGIALKDKKVLIVSAMDRFGMAEAFKSYGCSIIYGDLIFALGIPIPIKKISTLHILATILMPIISRLPFKMLYPTGSSQDSGVNKYSDYYKWADIIAGDYLYIKKHLPENLEGKIIVTNTVTSSDVEVLREKGARMLITSTPELNGRSFGTNVLEAIVVAASGKKPEDITSKEYTDIINKCGFKHRVEYLN